METLEKWLKSRKSSPKTISELAKKFKTVPYKTVYNWVKRGSIPKDYNLRKKLYNLTKISKYRSEEEKLMEFKQIQNAIYLCIRALEPLMEDEDKRRYFRKKIRKNDISFLSSLLEALMNEERFSVWQTFQNIKIEKKSKRLK